MNKVVISGTGIYIPPNKITNEEIVESFNTWADKYNAEHKNAIEDGKLEAIRHSNAEFIEKVSGIKQRYLIEKNGVLNTERMAPRLEPRDILQVSYSAEMALSAAKQALKNANVNAEDLDMIVCSASNPERAYPGIGIELQELLSAKNAYSYDMNIGCSSASFGLKVIYDAIKTGSAKKALLVSPEICSGHISFMDRDSHFIFSDACSAVVVENKQLSRAKQKFEILDMALITKFSNNIRNDFGYLTRWYEPAMAKKREMFIQNGNKVFKEVSIMVSAFVAKQLQKNNLDLETITRIWLHQANINMDLLIAKRIFKKEITEDFMPNILKKYANTSSAGAFIAFHETHDDLKKGDIGIICTFGAGYSIGSAIIKKC